VAVIALNLAKLLHARIARGKGFPLQTSKVTLKDYVAPLTSLALFVIWLLPHPYILRRLRQVWSFIVGEAGRSPFTKLEESFDLAGLTMSQTIELFIARYGAILMYGIIAGIAALVVLRMSLSRKAQPDLIPFAYAILFVVGLGASAFSLFAYTGETGPERISRLFLIVAPVVCGLVFYELISRQQPLNMGRLKVGRKVGIAVASVLIVTACVLSIFCVYNSPRVMRTSWQVTRMEIVGTAWFGRHRVANIAIATARLALGRYDDFNFGVDSAAFPRAARYPPTIPSHFGYDKHTSVAEAFNFTDTYLVISERGKMSGLHLPENVRHMVPEYTHEDLARLSADPTAAKIYSTGEFEVWRVYAALL